jgi:hypothetical protein
MKKWLVEVWEHRQVSFEVEAENEEEAKDVAIDAYVNSDRLQDIMIHDDESIASSEAKVIQCLGEANGIVCEDKEKEGIRKSPAEE